MANNENNFCFPWVSFCSHLNVAVSSARRQDNTSIGWQRMSPSSMYHLSAKTPFSSWACRGSSASPVESLESATSCYCVQLADAALPLGRTYRSKGGCARLVGRQRAVGPQLQPFAMPNYTRGDRQRLLAPLRDLQASVEVLPAPQRTGPCVSNQPVQHAWGEENLPLFAQQLPFNHSKALSFVHFDSSQRRGKSS